MGTPELQGKAMQEVQAERGARPTWVPTVPQWAQCLVTSGEIHGTLTTQRIK